MTFKLVLVSDTHTMHGRLDMPEGDILIHAGDISYQGKPHELMSFNSWLAQLPYEYKILVPGNHDLMFETDLNAAEEYVSEALVLDQQSVYIDRYHFYGEPRQIEFFNWAFNVPRNKMKTECWDKVPTDVDVLITHGPPFGVGDTNMQGVSCGCQDLYNWIHKNQPKLVVCGHIHEGYGMYKIGNTTVVNAAICTASYQPTNKPVVIDLDLL